MEYPIFWKDDCVGTAEVIRQGLYWELRVCAALPGEAMHRLWLYVGDWKKDLGTLIPISGGFGLVTHLAAKRIPAGDMEFWIDDSRPIQEPPEKAPEIPAEPESETPDEPTEPEMTPEPEAQAPVFYPVEENKPFPAVERLDTARLAEQDGEVGIVIDE